MSVRARAVEAPGRVARRVQAAERVKSGAAQRAYARRRLRAEQLTDTPDLPTRRVSAMATRIPFVAAIIALLGCGLAGTLLLTTRAAEDSYQLGDARQINRKLSEERAALQREVEAADSAPALAARAREFGMIPAKDPARIVVAPDGTVTVIGKPTPAQGPPVPPLNTAPSAPLASQPGHVLAQGERVVPVSTPRQPTVPGQPNTEQANGAQAHASSSSPTPTSPAAASPVPVAAPPTAQQATPPASAAPVDVPQPESPQPQPETPQAAGAQPQAAAPQDQPASDEGPR
ncbi:hypothetical protein [Nocardia sp. NBC_01009]|uniref:hypothetical protein n=1 Tax=Nocardia sp. NBC_01009 TaxID=2975996 RepID=UPI00386E05E9|nr:hypothetical protein OHA42_15740 [Nocardia sp. NBC_01009]